MMKYFDTLASFLALFLFLWEKASVLDLRLGLRRKEKRKEKETGRGWKSMMVTMTKSVSASVT